MQAKVYYRWVVILGFLAIGSGAYLAITRGDARSWGIDQWCVFVAGGIYSVLAWACLIEGNILEKRSKKNDPKIESGSTSR